MEKIILIGNGDVGSSYSFALVAQGIGNEIGIIDLDKAKAAGDIQDLNHGLAYVGPKTLYVADYEDCRDADLVVITAGAAQLPHETRLDLTKKNAQIMKKIVKSVIASGFQGIFLIASNPVDVLTHYVKKITGFPSHKVIGSGTSLDSARLRNAIGEQLTIDPRDIQIYVLGEHGDTQFPVWSHGNIGGLSVHEWLEKHPNFSEQDLGLIAEKVKNAVGKLDQISRFLISKCGEQITFRLQNSASLNDKNICHVTDAIWPAGDTFSAFLDLFPEITVTYINENMMDFLNGLVNTDPSENQNQTNDYTLDFVLQVLTKRLLVIKNLEESIPFIQTLYRIGTSFQGEISFIGFKHMTYFLSAFPLPPQIASELAEQFSSFIESIPENDEDGSEQYKGYSMSAFAVLLDKNRDSLDYETLSYQFLEFLPILDEWLTATYLYDYIATLILEKNPGLSSNIDTIIHDFVYKVDKFNIEELTDKGLKALRAALIDPALHDLVSIDLIQAYNENPTNQLLKTLIEGIQT